MPAQSKGRSGCSKRFLKDGGFVLRITWTAGAFCGTGPRVSRRGRVIHDMTGINWLRIGLVVALVAGATACLAWHFMLSLVAAGVIFGIIAGATLVERSAAGTEGKKVEEEEEN
jgi:hypothetical protein